ncbi:rhodanese-like domain-containing protein [Paenimyroides ceti]
MNIKIILGIFLLFGITTATAQQASFIRAQDVSAVQQQDYLLIDVRTPEEYQEGTIPSAINIDVENDAFRSEVEKIDKNTPLIIFCKLGGRSETAAEILSNIGFTNVKEIEGGFEAWRAVQEGK